MPSRRLAEQTKRLKAPIVSSIVTSSHRVAAVNAILVENNLGEVRLAKNNLGEVRLV